MAFAGPPPDDEPDDTTTVTSKPAAGQKQVATGDDRVMKAKDMLLRLEAGARIYKNDSGKLPGNLQILLKSNDDHPQGYLPGLKEIPKDPWGSDYFYEVTEDGKTFHLRSFGANAKDDGGAGDDIKSDS
ncbi:MAG: type II secretion system protein GspG [Planctomycetes bacterium]|nr:type II secretion system protein GspG [Planctomycetota bacterium]